jgi:molecular chaperone GrpE (heat shock protein)
LLVALDIGETQPTNDPAQEGVVCGVLTPGYLINEGVLRPAMVAVGLSSNHAVSA